MDYTRIQIDSIGIGLSNIYNLDLTRDNFIKTHLAVGEIYNESHDITLDTNNLNHYHNLVVTEKAVGVNTSRNIIISKPNNSLIVEGNIRCMGTITAENILLSEDINISSDLSANIQTFNQVLNRISSHLLFYPVKDYLQENIYTNHNVTIGSINHADNNTNPLKISRHCNNNISNIQFVIQNNDITNNIPTRFSCGIIGGENNCPFHMITSPNMPLHFNISKTYSDIDNLYISDNDRTNTPNYTINQYPSLALDVNGSVLINLDKITSEITYDFYTYNIASSTIISNKTEYPNLYVKGSLYSDIILINDYVTNTPKSLDSLYIRQGTAGGLSLYANQIRGGNFNKDEFIFNSNVYIGTDINNYKLKIYGNCEITSNLNINKNLISTNVIINSNLIVNGTGISDFNNVCYFSGGANFNTLNCTDNIQTKSITVTDNIYYKGTSIDHLVGIGTTSSLQFTAVPETNIDDLTFLNYINVGGQTTAISDGNYNSQIINIYKHRDNQKNQYELYLHDTTITPYGSEAYIGHAKLNTLDNELDNSLVILTQYNTTWNNIYFYAGKNKLKINDTPPNLGIFENNKIGINTIRPIKTLDINGDIITSNYYIRKNNIEYECDMIIRKNNYNYLSNLTINDDNNDDINDINKKKLNVNGGINSYDGYYEGNYKLCSIKYLNSSNAIIQNTNIGLGVQYEDPKITIPFKIQNTNIDNKKINNSVISFYRSTDNSKYSGIEFCDDSTNIATVSKNKWYIYKNHITDDATYAGPLQIGYMKNSYKPKKSCINLYYDNDKYYIDINNPITYTNASDFNKNKEDMRITGNVKITGDIDIDGSINIKGNYRFNDNNILFSPNPVETIINKIYSLGNNVYYYDTILSPNYPKRISFTNCNLAYDTYVNILDDRNNFNRELNSNNSTSNFIVSSNNYEFNKLLLDDVISYNNFVITTSNNTNNYLSYINTIRPEIDNIYNLSSNIKHNYLNSNITTIYTSNSIDYSFNNNSFITEPDIIIRYSDLLFNALNNVNYSYSNYRLSSNIYDIISNLYTTTTTTSNSSLNLVGTSINDMILASNISNLIVSSYANIIHNADINIIEKFGYSNLEYSSNIYSNSLLYYNNISNISNQILINNPNFSIISKAYVSKSLLYTDYISSSNFYHYWKNPTLKKEIIGENISEIIATNNNISSNNLKYLDYLKNTDLNIYYNFYNNISNLILPIKTNITITSNLLVSNTNSTNNIYQALTIPIRSYLDSAYINSNNAYSNYQLISNISNEYSNVFLINIDNIYKNSNVISKYTTITSNLKININENNNSNQLYYDTFFNKIDLAQFLDLYSNASNTTIYSLNSYKISSNIYNDINYINNYISDYITTANNYRLLSSNYLNNSINIYNNLSNIYINKNYITDIANILKTGNSNKLIASNIYQSSSNFYRNIENIKIISSNYTIISSNDMINSSNYYFNNSNFQISHNSYIEIPESAGLDVLSNLLVYNSNNSVLTLNNITTIYDNIYNNYPLLYSKINSELYNNINLNSNLILNNINSTTRIVDAVKTDINTYLNKAIINKNNSSNLDLIISRFDPDFSSNLLFYSNTDEIRDGINAVKNYIDNLKITMNNFKSDIITLCSNFSYLFELNEDLNAIYNETIVNITYNINLLREITAEIINLDNNINDKELLLQLILHNTNKYINFINNSYTLSNSLTLFVETLSNYIGIYINTSLSLIPLLNTLIEYANMQLNLSWSDISQQIVLFASLSYSVNSSIKSITTVNTTGQNTDVLIIGNNIKIYPTRSLIIGHDNDYSKWLESINDIDNNSAAYIYNNKFDSCACSFNCRSKTFLTSGAGDLSLKSSSSIDINLIDTLIKPDPTFEKSIIDGVSLKISNVFHRATTDFITSSRTNSIFEITRKKLLSKPYFSFYTTENDINIMNIGGGQFYNSTNDCIVEDTLVHINDTTSENLLKLTNNSTNPIKIGFTQNNINNWQLSVSNTFSYNYNLNNVLTITSNGLAINSDNNDNASIFINSFNNKSALELKNNYISLLTPIIDTKNINVNNKLQVSINENGIIYSKKNDDNTDYDLRTTNFYYTSNILFGNITHTLRNISVNYNNINDNLKFTYNDTLKTVDLLPILQFNDPNISYYYAYNINYTIATFNFDISIVPADSPSIRYKVPKVDTNLINVSYQTLDKTNSLDTPPNGINYSVDNPNLTRVLVTTNIIGSALQGEDLGIVKLDYTYSTPGKNIKIYNYIIFNKYASFNLDLLDLTLSNYNYNLIRLNNIIPTSLYNGNFTNTIVKIQENDKIIINNTINYLRLIPDKPKEIITNSENKLKVYPIKLNNKLYNIPIDITINDTYDIYKDCDLFIDYVKTTAKLPLIKQTNIYNNAHNIYSFTDDYEIYLNDTKLLNINSQGTLNTTGNIETNNIYLKGDIYNSDGLSLYDNILSLINNVSSTTNFELNTRNIILNPAVGYRDTYKGGILVNGNNINIKNNNLFQINNFSDNDNFLTLNSCTANSYIHFNNKITKVVDNININYNSIYKIGLTGETFGIWKYNLSEYNNNLFIDTNNTTNCKNALEINYNTSTTNFELNFKGTISSIADNSLRRDISVIDNALNKLTTLQGITYENIGSGSTGKRQTGLLAEEVNNVLPEAVYIDNDGYYNIAYGNLAGLIIESIKDLKNQINSIKTHLNMT
jgi:hypothetical protein